jgi:hypothetical protein
VRIFSYEFVDMLDTDLDGAWNLREALVGVAAKISAQ